jgi:putative transposase
MSLTGKHAVGAFEDRVSPHDLPKSITVNHGTEFTSKAVDAWAFYPGVELDFTRRGKQTDNVHIESFNGRLLDVCLNVHRFLSLDHARKIIEAWRRDYNDRRPHSSLGDLTPSAFTRRPQVHVTATER